ncbi:MAG: mercury methylation ferredoxin HgcB [Desulfuromonadaceae bacterium]
MKGFRYLADVATLKLDHAICVGCNRCFEVCPHQVFSVRDKKASIVELDACMECGACAKNCPVTAITVDAGVGCASGIINEWLRERNLKLPGSGGCCS